MRLEQEAEERDAKRPLSYIAEILQHWRCTTSCCTNKDGYCYIDDDRKHLPFTGTEIIPWNTACLKETADVFAPPTSWIQSMKARKALRVKAKTAATAPTVAGTTVNNYINTIPDLHHFKHSEYLPNLTMTDPGRFSEQRDIPHSSPVGSDSDPGKEIEEYVNWLIAKVPGQRELLQSTKEKLNDVALDLAQLRRLDESVLERMDIPLGIRMRLQSNVKAFKRSKRQN